MISICKLITICLIGLDHSHQLDSCNDAHVDNVLLQIESIPIEKEGKEICTSSSRWDITVWSPLFNVHLSSSNLCGSGLYEEYDFTKLVYNIYRNERMEDIITDKSIIKLKLEGLLGLSPKNA